MTVSFIVRKQHTAQQSWEIAPRRPGTGKRVLIDLNLNFC